MAEEGVTRRLAAIVAADVAGYTRLMEADENATIAAWKAARIDMIDPKIAEYQGRIVKHTGDGFLAEFRSVTDAVNCAIDMQKLLAARAANTSEHRRMNFRMGVNLGDIVEELDDIHGDGVNIAARLEGLAEPGGICVSGSVYEQVRKLVDLDFEDLGSQKVKNIAEPVRAYRVNIDARPAEQPGEAPPSPGPPSTWPIHGGEPVPSAGRGRAFLFWTAKVVLLLAFLFVIDLFTSEGWWVHWVALAAPFVIAAKALKVFGEETDGPLQTGNIDGDIVFVEDTKVTGNIMDNATVAHGVRLKITGNILRDLTLEEGSAAKVTGNIHGKIHNKGGTLRHIGNLYGKEMSGYVGSGSETG